MKSFKQFLLEAKSSKESSTKYKKGEFGYWWTVEKRNEDIEGKIYKGNIDCSNQKLTSLKGCPKEVTGYFWCNNNQLTSLEGCPKKVDDFECKKNQLTTLEGGPKEVKFSFSCVDNKLTSLKGAPKYIGRHFDCCDNKLTSLKGGPKEVGRDFDCSFNQLTSLKGCPEEVGGNFYCKLNKLKKLDSIPNVLEGRFLSDLGGFANIDKLKDFVYSLHKPIKNQTPMEDLLRRYKGGKYVAMDEYGYTYIYKDKPYYEKGYETYHQEEDEFYYTPGSWDGDRISDDIEYKFKEAYKKTYGKELPRGGGKTSIWAISNNKLMY